MLLKLKKFLINIIRPTSLKVGLLITIINVFFLIKHYMLPKGSLDIIGQMETKLYDIRFKIRGPQPMSGRVGALTADDKSIERFGRWPFRRDIYEQAFSNLKKAGVKWIGLDVLFSEPSRRYLDETLPDLEKMVENKNAILNLDSAQFKEKLSLLMKNSPGDISLSRAIEDYKNIVQSYFYEEKNKQIIGSTYNWSESFEHIKNSSNDFVDLPKDKSLSDYPEMTSSGVVSNTAIIAGKHRYMGFANNDSDSDGLIRKYLLVKIIKPIDSSGKLIADPILVSSLGLSIAANYLQSAVITHFSPSGIDAIELTPSDTSKETIKIPLYLDGDGRILINHYGAFNNIPQVSLQDAYDNRLPKKLPDILIYGGVGTGTNDKRPSPFDEHFDGVGFHIASIENILTKYFMKRSLYAPLIELSLLILSGILFSIILKYTSALTSALFILFIIIMFYFLDQYFIFGQGHWCYVGTFYVQSISIYIFITAFKYFTEEREKKAVKGAFQHYLNPSVINKLIENPKLLKLGGEKKMLTVFFSDVRGFTTISELLSPEKLTSLLNEYFTPMTKIVFDSGGLLDKYIGDAMMAVWGTPIDLDDHADRAIRSSLLMLDELTILQNKWRNEGLPELDIGIGLNTGDMVVGNMGSAQRFDYTVLGDSVNLGSRIEGINKNYGTQIICSENTKNALKKPQDFLLRELDIIRVKGKKEHVKIYEVMQFNSQNKEMMEKIILMFKEGLEYYRASQWENAAERFQAILKIKANDGPCLEFIDRCEYLKHKKFTIEEPWEGIWNFTTK